MTAHRFDEKSVLVTGGSSGIGRAAVLAFAHEGAHVTAVGRDGARLAEVQAEAAAGVVETIAADLAAPGEAERAVEAAIARDGRLHVLVNCAGVALQETVLEATKEGWDLTMATNLTAVFFASQTAARHMAAQGGGAIVNVASIDALVADAPYAHYSISKAGVVMMTRAFAHELGHVGVRCNAVAPGVTRTPMTTGAISAKGSHAREIYDFNMGRIPLRRGASAEEQAAVILFLASEDASYVNGETVVVDGGQLAGYWYSPFDAPPVPRSDVP
ncbi:MAG TPA: SDR family oxidoreductase [Thermoleophilia bacterium]|nr:SDR family oxidoreductase [Thermoleophilia bacterium]